MSAQETIGTVLAEPQARDAIHFALYPVLLGERMKPGSFVKFAAGSTEMVHHSHRDEAVGMVDPFITETLEVGSRVWMFLMPNTVTSLRHVWEHPAFGDAPAEPAKFQPFVIDDAKAASEQWLRDFAERADSPCTYEQLVALASGERVSINDSYGPSYNEGDWILISGSDASGPIPPEFWTHVQIVTGQKIPKHMHAEHFSCSC